jgi:hypothetical protein
MTRRPRQQLTAGWWSRGAAAGWLSRTAAVLLAVIASTAGAAVAGTPAFAAARPVGDCTTTSGVVVVVDFGHWGGPLLRSCGTTPTSSYALLNQGGWHTAGTEHDGPGFVCRIGYAGYHGGSQYPTPAQESCVLTPPASAYWSFWHASRGQHTWSYSQAGAMSYNPEPGSVELWVFGSTTAGGTAGSAVPAFSPDSVRALNTSPAGPAISPATTSPDGAASTSAAAGGTSAPAAISPAPRGRKSAPAARATPPRTPAVLDAPPAAASAHVSRGSPVPALIALLVVLLLAAAGITAAARRPRRER